MNQPNPEVIYWQRVAVYLADCHAANCSIAELKKTSKFERGRLVAIMRRARRMIQEEFNALSMHGCSDLNDVANRLQYGIDIVESKYPETKEPNGK